MLHRLLTYNFLIPLMVPRCRTSKLSPQNVHSFLARFNLTTNYNTIKISYETTNTAIHHKRPRLFFAITPSRSVLIVTPRKIHNKIKIKRRPNSSTSISSLDYSIILHTKLTSASSQSAISKSKAEGTKSIIVENGMVRLQTKLQYCTSSS